uniref:Uncharacterized protein n=1 Tax=Arundo donax TaxID=35708 RepID=A0A0A8YZ38_ARUDO
MLQDFRHTSTQIIDSQLTSLSLSTMGVVCPLCPPQWGFCRPR